MKTTIQTLENCTIATLNGCLDTAATQDFADKIQPLMEIKDSQIILDCSQLEYISSGGLRQFIILLKTTKSHGTALTIRNLSEAVLEVFKITGFDHIFHIE